MGLMPALRRASCSIPPGFWSELTFENISKETSIRISFKSKRVAAKTQANVVEVWSYGSRYIRIPRAFKDVFTDLNACVEVT